MPANTKKVKQIYDDLNSRNQSLLQKFVCTNLKISRYTFLRRLKDGFDLVEEKIFFSWFEEHGVSIEEAQQFREAVSNSK